MGDMTEVKIEEEENNDFDVSRLYTPLSVAKEEIWKRWNDEDLKKKVREFLGEDILKEFENGPTAALFRVIASPNLEFQRAVDMANIIDLDMVCWEFLNDKFCTRNADKIHLGKLTFFHEKDKEKSQSVFLNKKRIIDLQGSDGMAFKDIKTTNGIRLVDFHHSLLYKMYGNIRMFDASKFKMNGESAESVYEKVFAFCTCYGVIFENYIFRDDHYEKKFVSEVIFPAIEKVESIFGVKPLIVPLLPIRQDSDDNWMWYSSQLESSIKE